MCLVHPKRSSIRTFYLDVVKETFETRSDSILTRSTLKKPIARKQRGEKAAFQRVNSNIISKLLRNTRSKL